MCKYADDCKYGIEKYVCGIKSTEEWLEKCPLQEAYYTDKDGNLLNEMVPDEDYFLELYNMAVFAPFIKMIEEQRNIDLQANTILLFIQQKEIEAERLKSEWEDARREIKTFASKEAWMSTISLIMHLEMLVSKIGWFVNDLLQTKLRGRSY